MAQRLKTTIRNAVSSFLVGLVTFVGLATVTPPESVSANSYSFISSEALAGFGFSSADEFKGALLGNIASHLNNDYYPNGCIQFVMAMYQQTLNMHGGPQPDSPYYGDALTVANSFVNDAGTQWATVTGFATDPQVNQLTGGITMTPINNDLSARLSEFGTATGDIIILGGGHTTEDAYKCTVTYTTSPSSGRTQSKEFVGYATASACRSAAQHWIASHNPSNGYYNVRMGNVTSYEVSTGSSKPYGHIAIYQGHDRAVWQATFSYSSNSGSQAFEANLGNTSTGSKAYQNVCVLKVAGSATPGPRETETYHAAGGKVILISEWNDLVAAYGEAYVRSNVSFEISVNQDCEVVTDIGPDGVYGIGPGEDQLWNTADDIRDDTYYPVAAGQVLWSGNLNDISQTTIQIGDYQYYQFALPAIPTDGVFMKIDENDPDITITIRETGAFNALFPG